MNQKIAYLANSTRKTLQASGFSCPSCGSHQSTTVRRKYIVTVLRRCSVCELQFRTPTTSVAENAAFYQEAYTQGFTTDCPTDEDLAGYLRAGFVGSVRDYSQYIEIVRAAGQTTGARLFEFGCSWGYGSWQFRRAGFDVEAYEISAPRARYAKQKLGIRVHDTLDQVKGPFDIFFTSHVLEHVPSVRLALDFARTILKPGGLIVAITPNGSVDFRRRAGTDWNKLWGLVHPNFLDERFYHRYFRSQPRIIQSNPYDLRLISDWAQGRPLSAIPRSLDNEELLCVVRPR